MSNFSFRKFEPKSNKLVIQFLFKSKGCRRLLQCRSQDTPEQKLLFVFCQE